MITNMDDLRYKIMSQLKHFVCPACEKGILAAVAEVGIESEGSTAKFQTEAVRSLIKRNHL